MQGGAIKYSFQKMILDPLVAVWFFWGEGGRGNKVKFLGQKNLEHVCDEARMLLVFHAKPKCEGRARLPLEPGF